ncbi:MAG: FecR domain-containing protein [Candidatus Omnitrophica bacterium]|nr:FecR domain-containing protein [Candidatus Omnitrophota bacterium]
MRRWICALVGISLFGSLTIAEAQTAPPPDRIGVAAAVRGGVQLQRPGQAVGQVLQTGQPIFLGERITTNAQGQLQILLLDETVFTIGPNSALVIDTFIYDPRTNAGKISAQALQGVFRFVTGKIARRRPSDMEVKLPVGVIGIRGTIVAGRIEGSQSKVVLLGPGPKNNTGERPGQITVSNRVGNVTHEVTVTRPGFGTTIAGPDALPTPPAAVPPAELDALTSALAAPAAQAPAPAAADPAAAAGASMTRQAGQDLAVALTKLTETKTTTDISQDLGDESTTSATQVASQSVAIADGISTKDQLRTIETGVFSYQHTGAVGSFVQTRDSGSAVNIQGTVTVKVDIDFGARTIGGGNSSLTVDTSSFLGSIFKSETIEAQSFNSGSGNATFTDTSSDGVLTGTLTLNNSGGVVAATATGEATYDSLGSTVGSTGSFTMTKQAGAS